MFPSDEVGQQITPSISSLLCVGNPNTILHPWVKWTSIPSYCISNQFWFEIVRSICAHLSTESDICILESIEMCSRLKLIKSITDANSRSALMLSPCPPSSVSCHQKSNHLSSDASLQSGNWPKVKQKNSGEEKKSHGSTKKKEWKIMIITMKITMLLCFPCMNAA